MVRPLQVIKTSFAGGEYTPSLHSRVDLQRYSTGAKKLHNFIVHATGGISNAPGTYHVSEGKYDNKKIRLIRFLFSTLQKYVLEFGEYYIRFKKDGAVILKYSTWVTSTAYAVGDYIKNSTTYYYCAIAHTSGTFATDLAAGKWTATSWTTSTGYVAGDYIVHTGVMYYCKLAHTSGTFLTDLNAEKWIAQTIYEVPTPYTEDDLQYLDYTQSADVLYIASPDYQTRELSRLGDNKWTIGLYDFLNGPFMLPNTDDTKKIQSSLTAIGASTELTATGFIFQEGTLHVGSLWQLEHYVEGQSVSYSGASTSAPIKCGGTWRLITHGNWTGKIKIEKSKTGAFAGEETMLREFSSANDYNADTYGTEDMSDGAEPFYIRINCYSGSVGTADLSSDPFYQRGIVKITAVAVGGATATAIIMRTIGIAATDTIDWAEGSWSDYRGWPATVEFHPEDRLVFANTYSEPQTAWTTQTGNYYNFFVNSPLVDSDAISANLPSREVNGINALVPLSELIALTASCEASLRASSGALSPTTANFRVSGYSGAEPVKPVVVGNRAIYVQSIGTIVRDMGYDDLSQSFEGVDLSVMANHLFEGHSIIELAYQQNPDKIVWAVRDDGVLLSMTYMREQEVVAWTPHYFLETGAPLWETDTAYLVGDIVMHDDLAYTCATGHTSDDFDTDLEASKWTLTDITAQVESICVIPATGYNELWLSVKRGIKRYIERMVQRLASTEPEDQFFVHSGITYNSETPATVITGLDHLEGKYVAVLADGNVIHNYLNPILVESGQITLATAALKVHVGIPYLPDGETLNIDEPSLQGKKIKVSQIELRLLNSRGGYIGPDTDNLHEIEYNAVTEYDTALPLASDNVKENLGAGYEDGGRICFRQFDPLPFTLLALIPTITPGGVTAT